MLNVYRNGSAGLTNHTDVPMLPSRVCAKAAEADIGVCAKAAEADIGLTPHGGGGCFPRGFVPKPRRQTLVSHRMGAGMFPLRVCTKAADLKAQSRI